MMVSTEWLLIAHVVIAFVLLLLQVAGRVDMLDGRVKQEQESSLRALEAILSESGHGKH